MKDSIVAEIHRHRAEDAKRLNYDLHAICEDIRKSQAESNGKFVTWDARRKRLVGVKRAKEVSAKKLVAIK